MNKVPSKATRGAIPHQLLYGALPNYYDLRVFGYLCFVSTLTHGHSILESRACKCILLGFHNGMKGYISRWTSITKKSTFLKVSNFMILYFLIVSKTNTNDPI